MSEQPFLGKSAVSFEGARYRMMHNVAFCDADSSEEMCSHIHNYYEIYIKIAGDVSFFYQNEIYPLEKCDLIISGPGEMHHCVYHSSCVHDHWCIWLRGGAFEQYIEQYALTGAVRLPASAKKEMLSILSELDGETDAFTETMLLMRLLSQLREKGVRTSVPADALPEKLRDILVYIDENFTTIDTVEGLAERFFISVPTINRLFREHVRLSPHKLIEIKRLAYAEQLLRQGYSVTEACYASGFADCSRFIGKFKSRFGTTPKQYIKR